MYPIDKNWLIWVAPVDDTARIVISEIHLERLLYRLHHPVMAGHPGQWCMYDSMRREFYWAHMTKNVYISVDNCSACAGNGTSPKLKPELQLATSSLFEFVTIDIYGSLPRTLNEIQYVLVMTDRYSKPTEIIRTSMISSTHFANLFFESLKIYYGTPTYDLADNEVQFLSKFFAMLWTMWRSDTIIEDRKPPANEWAGWSVKSYDSHITTELCCRKRERLKYVRTAAKIRVQCKGAQVYRHDPL